MTRLLLATFGTMALLTALVKPARADEPSPAAATAPAPSAPAATTAPAETGEATLTTARRIAEEGLGLYDSGKYAEALTRFERAGALVKAPTMGLMQARSLEKLGRWVEASERYLDVTRMPLGDNASEAFKEAQASATQERAALMPRIPSLTIRVSAAPAGAAVTLDGKPVAAALLGVAFPCDPGAHTVTLQSGSAKKTVSVVVREAEAKKLSLAPDVAPPPLAANSGVRAAGWISVVLGGAGVVVGAVTTGLTVSANADLIKDNCVDGVCHSRTSSAHPSDVDNFNTLRSIPAPAFVAGGILAAAGVLTLGLSYPSAKAPRQGTLQTWIGPAGGGARVTF